MTKRAHEFVVAGAPAAAMGPVETTKPAIPYGTAVLRE